MVWMRRSFAVTLALLAGALSVTAQEKPAPAATVEGKPALTEGNYLLSYGSSPTLVQRMAILKVTIADGKPAATVEDAGPGRTAPEVRSITAAGGKLTLVIKFGANEFTFEGAADPKDPKKYRGTFGGKDFTFRGFVEETKLEKLEQKDMFFNAPPTATMKEIAALNGEVGKLRVKARQETDADEKKKLNDEATELAKVNEPKVAALYRKLVQEPDIGQAAVAAEQLLNGAKKSNASEADVKAWAKVVVDEAAAYSPKLVAAAKTRVGTALVEQEKYGKLALSYLGELMEAKDQPKKTQYATLKLMARAQTQAGLTDEAAATTRKLVKIDAELDAEYLATVPPFKPKAYEGRADKSANRVVVMELFTGAQCPPCVAADVGFDGLIKSYKAQDVVFLQYHEHIPGPDPLTTQDSVDRMAYYGKLHPKNFGGTPSTAFNGKPASGGGGGMAGAEGKYKDYTKVINEALEESSEIKVAGSAKLKGDDLAVSVELGGMKDAKEGLKLRLVLVEENIKYVGGNGLRFHHHVVRSLLGTVKGVDVAGLKDGKFTTTKSLTGLREELTKYLDEYATTRPFPYPDRPMDLKHLKVVALVQDDKTGEILQATQLDIGG